MDNLIDISTEDLTSELDRRRTANANGCCDVCGAWSDESTCGSDRHENGNRIWYRRWRFNITGNWLEAYRSSYRVTASRYNSGVQLYSPYSALISETSIPCDLGDDRARLRAMIDWAIDRLAACP